MMITITEHVALFKRECQNYFTYKKLLETARLALEENQTKLEGVSSPRFELAHIENKQTDLDKELRRHELLEIKDKLEAEERKWVDRIKYVDDVLSMMNDDERLIVTLRLIFGMSISKVSKKVGYSYTYIGEKVDTIISRYV